MSFILDMFWFFYVLIVLYGFVSFGRVCFWDFIEIIDKVYMVFVEKGIKCGMLF